jgi:predicted AlkP superfamily pyrophosphatase or phosphodiesterase
MINDASLSRFEPLGDKLLKPIYADYSFGNISATIHFLLTGETLGPLLPPDCFGGAYPKPDKVVLFFIDAFGWKSWQRYLDAVAPMRRIASDGVLTPISALFPSTTAASVTTLALGVLPARHAIYEWNIYIPAYGEVITPLLFSPIGAHDRELCAARGYDYHALSMVHETVHERLVARGVRSVQIINRDYLKSSYNRITAKGSELRPHYTLAEGLLRLRQMVEAASGKAFFSFYWPAIDSIAHQHGPDGEFHRAESLAFWAAFDAILGGFEAPNTLFLFTADHDQVAGRAEDTIFINERWPELADSLAVSPTGMTIYPNGSPRDLFLHVKPERREEVCSLLRHQLAGLAEVMWIDEALELGLFGPDPIGAELRARLGDILILPFGGLFIGWRQQGIMGNPFHGHHGGLHADELITVFAAADRL